MSIPALPFRVKTTVSWAGEQEGDLGFLENEVIDVYSIVDESWWCGKLRRNNLEGIFPKDYVKIIETSSKVNSLSNTPSKLNTPIKDYTPSKSKRSPKKHDSYNEFSFDNSYENLSRSTDPYQKKSKLPFRDDRDLRQREIDRFRALQQQQEYHIKSQIEMDRQKRLLQQDFGRYSVNVPESPTYKVRNSGGSKFRPQSANFDHEYSRQASTPNFRAFNQQYEFQNQTVESFSPEASPRGKKKHPYYNIEESSHDEELDEIALKKKQLELEILQLEELQRSTRQKKASKSPVSPSKMRAYENSNDSYVSEDLGSSKKNYHSREDLSKKLSRYATDEDINVYEYPLTNSDSHSPPPPPPKHQWDGDQRVETMQQLGRVPYDADDFRFSGNGSKIIMTEEEFLKLSQIQQEELKNSIKSLQSDVLNLSELSATSAGSFLRHKYEKEYQAEQELRMKNLSLRDEMMPSEMNGIQNKEAENKSLMDSMFQDKKSKQSNIFKKLLKKKDETTNPLEQKMQSEEGQREIDWTTFKLELNRMNTLTTQDKRVRTKRVVTDEPNLIIKPLDYVSEINSNETLSDDVKELDLPPQFFDKVDAFGSRYEVNCDLNDLISDIGIKFSSNKLLQLRAVLMHFTKFNIIDENGKIQQIKPKLNDILMKGEASIYQLNYLFKKVLDALRIPSEVVLGFWKKPNEFYHDEQYIINHCWLSVLVENQFLVIDLLNFKDTSICNIRDAQYNEFYFLAKPLTLVSTHIPSVIDLQHVIPPIDQNISFYLPRLYSGYYKNLLRISALNNALTRLKDSEIFEMDLMVPTDTELFTLVKTSKTTSNEHSLCQIYWKSNRRYAKIKAILPEEQKIGVLQVFSGAKGLQKHFNNIHELSMVIPLHHVGEDNPVKFVPRYPTVQSQNNDLYVKAPQTNKVIVKNSYNFEILQHPSEGITNSSKILNQDFKIVIESPSGKYFKLLKSEPGKPYGSFQSMIKCQEIGLYRGLVIGDSGNSWYVFAQWECIPGTVI